MERLAKDVNIPILYVTHSMEEILRLAEQVIVLDAGKVRASGELEAVWASDAMIPWLQQEEQSSVWNVTLSHQHDVYPMSALALGESRLWVNRLETPIGHRVRVRISAADVSLALSLPEQSSIRNILPAEVIEVRDYDDRVEVKLNVEQHTLWARISPWARDELDIAVGQRLFAQIKSVSISREVG